MNDTRKLIEALLTLAFLAAVMCLCILGLATIFHWPPSAKSIAAVAPGSSAEWAGWVQAIGSIAAIIFSYWLGSKHAEEARTHSWEILGAQKVAKEVGLQAVVNQVLTETLATIVMLKGASAKNFAKAWSEFQRTSTMAALAAFDNAPLYELGSAERIRLAFSIRECAETFRARADLCVADENSAHSWHAVVTAHFQEDFDRCDDLREEFDKLFRSNPQNAKSNI
ncbi:hypothetical protein [Achromobacter insolitus]|uniref:hypothetical protein n=1 Tax=Achromobacter insolitus TaxID=217204 RepID=UPI0027E1882A|nr:hypothetical protein [Achromobacter insolitus]MDQ6212344.1 hypothetical protein [Achromobacter insolitus]